MEPKHRSGHFKTKKLSEDAAMDMKSRLQQHGTPEKRNTTGTEFSEDEVSTPDPLNTGFLDNSVDSGSNDSLTTASTGNGKSVRSKLADDQIDIKAGGDATIRRPNRDTTKKDVLANSDPRKMTTVDASGDKNTSQGLDSLCNSFGKLTLTSDQGQRRSEAGEERADVPRATRGAGPTPDQCPSSQMGTVVLKRKPEVSEVSTKRSRIKDGSKTSSSGSGSGRGRGRKRGRVLNVEQLAGKSSKNQTQNEDGESENTALEVKKKGQENSVNVSTSALLSEFPELPSVHSDIQVGQFSDKILALEKNDSIPNGENFQKQLLGVEFSAVLRGEPSTPSSNVYKKELDSDQTKGMAKAIGGWNREPTCDNSSLLPDIVKRGYTPFLDGHKKNSRIKEIVPKLQIELKRLHNIKQDQMQSEFMIKQDFHVTELSTAFDLKVQTKDGKVRRITGDSEIFLSASKTTVSCKNIALVGNPNFGKTTFLCWLAYQWTCGRKPFNKFALCVSFEASIFQESYDVSDKILTFLTRLLPPGTYTYTKSDVLTALQDPKVEILFLLDGYDRMSDSGKQNVKRLLTKRSEFQNSTVILTTRPTEEFNLLRRFDPVIHMGGFSSTQLHSLLNTMYISPPRVKYFMTAVKHNKKLQYLSDLPMFFLGCIYNMVASFYFVKPCPEVNLQSLLNNVAEILGKKFGDPRRNYEMVFKELGRMMFNAMLAGYYSFTEQLLVNVFKEDFQFIQKCRVFYPTRIQANNVWTVSSKSLMVYFATFYLRCCWDDLKNDGERCRFLNEVFLGVDSTGDYVTVQKGGRWKTYMVGIVQDIVLSLDDTESLKSATFDMSLDVDGVERSQAFDSVNLLARLADRHLHRFHFQILEQEDEHCTKTFEDIINCLSVPYFCVDHSFYHNDSEDCNLLKVLINDDDEGVALRLICKTAQDNRIGRMQIDFDFLKVGDVFCVFRDILLHRFQGIELDDDLHCLEYGEVIYRLVMSILNCSISTPVSITCYDDVREVHRSQLENLNFSVFPCQKSKQNKVHMSPVRVFGSDDSFVESICEPLFRARKKQVLTCVNRWCDEAKRPGISVNIFQFARKN